MTARAAAGMGAGISVDEREVARLRMRTQGLLSRRFSSLEEVVAFHGAVQSQEYGYAKWSLGERVPGSSEADVDRALAEGTILRTHVARPTWHYVAREDIVWMQAATAHRVRAMMTAYDRALELDEPLYARSAEVIARTLEGGAHRTRTQLSQALAAAGIDAKGQRLGHIVMRAELDALICSGVPSGKQTTYALVSERAPNARVMEPDEALRELTVRYFTSHGPAAEKDFRWWSTLRAGEVRRGLELADGELERWTFAGRTYWWRPPASAEPEVGDDDRRAHLLQAYDEMVVGYTESRGVLDVAGRAGTVAGAPAFYHVLLVDGQIAGHWRRQERGGRLIIEVQPVRKLSRDERKAVASAAARYGRFCGMEEELTW